MYRRWISQILVLSLLIPSLVARPSASAKSPTVPDEELLAAPSAQAVRADLRAQGTDVDTSLREVVESEEGATVIYGLKRNEVNEPQETDRLSQPLMLIIHQRNGELLGVQTLSITRTDAGQTLTVESTPAASPDRFLRARISLPADGVNGAAGQRPVRIKGGESTTSEENEGEMELSVVTRSLGTAEAGQPAQTEVSLGTIKAQPDAINGASSADPTAAFRCRWWIPGKFCCIGNCFNRALSSVSVNVTITNILKFAGCIAIGGFSVGAAISCLQTSGLVTIRGGYTGALNTLLDLANCVIKCR